MGMMLGAVKGLETVLYCTILYWVCWEMVMGAVKMLVTECWLIRSDGEQE